MITYTPSEIEASRQETMRRLFGNLFNRTDGPISEGDDEFIVDPSNFTPGSNGYHEAVHSSRIMADMLDHTLLDHPVVASDSTAYMLAMNAHTALVNLFSHLVDIHEEDED